MSLDDLNQLEVLLQRFLLERDSELSESISKVTSLSLVSKIYEHEHYNLEHANFTYRWVKAIQSRQISREPI